MVVFPRAFSDQNIVVNVDNATPSIPLSLQCHPFAANPREADRSFQRLIEPTTTAHQTKLVHKRTEAHI